jgi:hypothetical protein
MEKIQSKCIVLGPDGPVKNPNRSKGGERGTGFTTETRGPKFSDEYLMDSVDMATEIAREKAKSRPGSEFHVLQTCKVYAAQITEPQPLHFDRG